MVRDCSKGSAFSTLCVVYILLPTSRSAARSAGQNLFLRFQPIIYDLTDISDRFGASKAMENLLLEEALRKSELLVDCQEDRFSLKVFKLC